MDPIEMFNHFHTVEESNTPLVVPDQFLRNSQIDGITYDYKKIHEQSILVIGANELSKNIVTQLLAFGFSNIYLWDSARTGERSNAVTLLEQVHHISPRYRSRSSEDTLESKAITSGFDALGFGQVRSVRPSIIINTVNNSYLSDVLTQQLIFRDQNLFIDAHTVMDHPSKMYGLTIESLVIDNPAYDQFRWIEDRDLSLFENKAHDPLMSIICAAYVGAMAARFTLEQHSTVFTNPSHFSLFPFAENNLSAGPAAKEVHYKGFFGENKIYFAGLGGGSLMLDTLIRLFDINTLWGIDRDRLDRTNLNRLIPFMDESHLGKKKTDVAAKVYSDVAHQQGKSFSFIDGTIYDSFHISDPKQIDIIFGMLSGFDNKLNLVALSQKLSKQKKHLLVDVGVDPFRFDVTNYLTSQTPCDHCRNLHDLAVVEYFSGHLPGCDKQPVGSTVFANYLSHIAILEAMKYVDPQLGTIASGSISGNLLPPIYEPTLLYNRTNALVSSECLLHMRTSPLALDPKRFIFEDTFNDGWNAMRVYERAQPESDQRGRFMGFFRYTKKPMVPTVPANVEATI